MNISEKGIRRICASEGFSAKPYLCPKGKPTIGYGTTLYRSGKKVTLDDPEITEEAALQELLYHVENRCYHVLTGLNLNRNQFDVLCDFVYNVGSGNFEGSTLRRMVQMNPNDPLIAAELAKWNKSGGKVQPGLVRRRKEDGILYFQK